jgi:hypothetical protein
MGTTRTVKPLPQRGRLLRSVGLAAPVAYRAGVNPRWPFSKILTPA